MAKKRKRRNRRNRDWAKSTGFHGYPLATIAFYGPDDKTVIKAAVGIFTGPGDEPHKLRRWVATDLLANPRIGAEITEFLKANGVRTVAASDGPMGCIHEEGKDFPEGEHCPFCPFWKGKQGSAAADPQTE